METFTEQEIREGFAWIMEHVIPVDAVLSGMVPLDQATRRRDVSEAVDMVMETFRLIRKRKAMGQALSDVLAIAEKVGVPVQDIVAKRERLIKGYHALNGEGCDGTPDCRKHTLIN